jgi:hypothetical protein
MRLPGETTLDEDAWRGYRSATPKDLDGISRKQRKPLKKATRARKVLQKTKSPRAGSPILPRTRRVTFPPQLSALSIQEPPREIERAFPGATPDEDTSVASLPTLKRLQTAVSACSFVYSGIAPQSLFQTSFLHDFDISVVNVGNLSTLPYTRTTNTLALSRSKSSPSSRESLAVDDHLRKALLVLKKELINVQLQSKLSRDVDSKIAKGQREYYRKEQLKGIRGGLGMGSYGKDRLIEEFTERAAQLEMPEPVWRAFDEELFGMNYPGAYLRAQIASTHV